MNRFNPFIFVNFSGHLIRGLFVEFFWGIFLGYFGDIFATFLWQGEAEQQEPEGEDLVQDAQTMFREAENNGVAPVPAAGRGARAIHRTPS